MDPSLKNEAALIAENGANTISNFVTANSIPKSIVIGVLTDLRNNPEKYIEQVEIAGQTHYIFARAVMKKMLELKNEVL